MILNHIDLQVSDIDAATKLFETLFGMRCSYRRAGQIAFLADVNTANQSFYRTY